MGGDSHSLFLPYSWHLRDYLGTGKLGSPEDWSEALNSYWILVMGLKVPLLPEGSFPIWIRAAVSWWVFSNREIP